MKVPALLVTGKRSPRLSDRLAKLLPDAEGIEVPGASHLMHEENALACNTVVESFRARHRRAT